MKRAIKTMISCVLVTSSVLCLASCSSSGQKYFQKVASYSFWDNKMDESIPQYEFYNIMNDFLTDGTKIVDGNVLSESGKIRKVAFLGLDGTRADAISNIFLDKNNFETNGYNWNAPYSGMSVLKQDGGVYLAYCGGEKGTDTEQSTSTSASWTTEFTGVLNNKHGVKENSDVKNMEYKTIMLQYAEKGLQTSLAFDWGPYFDINLKEEIKYLIKNPEINLTYKDIDRKAETNVDAIEKMEAENLEMYNFVANDDLIGNTPYDVDMRDYLLQRIDGGDDIVAGIFHNNDSNGHTYGFSNEVGSYVNSVRNGDNYMYDIINVIKEREAKFNEEWLIISTADHGGRKQGHGKQTYEERTIWVASNKAIDSKYFGKNYDGFKENK